MLHNRNILIVLFCFFTFTNCVQDKANNKELPFNYDEYKNNYAEGFKIVNNKNAKILEISDPWPQAEKTYRYLLLTKGQLHGNVNNENDFDGIITIPVEKIVVSSTTHIPALELLNVEETLVGFPGTDYVSSEKT